MGTGMVRGRYRRAPGSAQAARHAPVNAAPSRGASARAPDTPRANSGWRPPARTDTARLSRIGPVSAPTRGRAATSRAPPSIVAPTAAEQQAHRPPIRAVDVRRRCARHSSRGSFWTNASGDPFDWSTARAWRRQEFRRSRLSATPRGGNDSPAPRNTESPASRHLPWGGVSEMRLRPTFPQRPEWNPEPRKCQ